jgi:hypothetical protein
MTMRQCPVRMIRTGGVSVTDLRHDKEAFFPLGHALEMKYLSKSRSNSDKINTAELAALLRGGLFPIV